MISLFLGKSVAGVSVNVLEDVLVCDSRLAEGVHAYVYSDLISVESLECDADECFIFLRGQSNISLIAVLVFFGSSGEKLSGGSSPANQVGRIEIPKNATHFKIALRLMQVGVAEIYSFDVGRMDKIKKVVAESNSFNYKESLMLPRDYKSKVSLKIPLIVVETVFCDTETDPHVMSRYLSYFVGLIHCVGTQKYNNFIWFIHVSDDKGRAVDVIRSAIERFGLSHKVYLNIYSHPKEGYGNEAEVHIDRIRRPNSTYPERRDNLFSGAVQKSGFYKESELEGCVVIRVALDDDDFITASHFELLQSLGSKYSAEIDNTLLTVLISINRLFVSYFLPNGNVDVCDVEFSRAMTGCKFSVSKGAYPRSPFSITERFDEVDRSRPEVLYVEHSQNLPSFSYNRHGDNLSAQNKSLYYKDEHAVVTFASHAKMLEEFARM
ncbi:hypothetical protein [uncultured Pseudomonas sp.]|uniref:hypothetical protein n=1 Tax=uncultured Pseudomonas sp. TaxID=114707 RepID=UPI0013C4FC87|nr:hypothetical protein [uncultured Pseudomonas sp.]